MSWNIQFFFWQASLRVAVHSEKCLSFHRGLNKQLSDIVGVTVISEFECCLMEGGLITLIFHNEFAYKKVQTTSGPPAALHKKGLTLWLSEIVPYSRCSIQDRERRQKTGENVRVDCNNISSSSWSNNKLIKNQNIKILSSVWYKSNLYYFWSNDKLPIHRAT